MSSLAFFKFTPFLTFMHLLKLNVKFKYSIIYFYNLIYRLISNSFDFDFILYYFDRNISQTIRSLVVTLWRARWRSRSPRESRRRQCVSWKTSRQLRRRPLKRLRTPRGRRGSRRSAICCCFYCCCLVVMLLLVLVLVVSLVRWGLCT